MIKLFRRCLSTKRPEAKLLRNKLIEIYHKNYGFCFCSICTQRMPCKVLDVSHLRPRSSLEPNEYRNLENVEFMCKNCHSLWDNGLIGVNNRGFIAIKNEILDFTAFQGLVGKCYSRSNQYNKPFLVWHYLHIFQK